MKRPARFVALLLIAVAAFTSSDATPPDDSHGKVYSVTVHAAATRTGSTPCRACKNCKYCNHCAKQSGTCGVCKR